MRRFLKDEAGLETVEYAVILSLIAATAVAAWTSLGDSIETEFDILVDLLRMIV